jgi:hypothetical protein
VKCEDLADDVMHGAHQCKGCAKSGTWMEPAVNFFHRYVYLGVNCFENGLNVSIFIDSLVRVFCSELNCLIRIRNCGNSDLGLHKEGLGKGSALSRASKKFNQMLGAEEGC